jgi:regulator of ribonuclease activity A
MHRFSTADLCDANGAGIEVAAPIFTDFGGSSSFGGAIATVRVRNDNVLVREALDEPGRGRVLVVDGDGSVDCALLGDRLVSIAHANEWAGIIVNGCVRDTASIGTIPLGVKALGAHPRKSEKLGSGVRDHPVSFAGVTFRQGGFVYADPDGIIVSDRALI